MPNYLNRPIDSVESAKFVVFIKKEVKIATEVQIFLDKTEANMSSLFHARTTVTIALTKMLAFSANF